MDAFALVLFVCTGIVAGTLAGLMGLGGGLFYVPLTVWVLEGLATPPEVVPFVAVTTSLAIILLSLPNSAFGHWTHGNVAWNLLPSLLLGGGAAAWGASLLLVGLKAEPFKLYLGLFQIAVAVRMFMPVEEVPPHGHKPSRLSLAAIGAFSGSIAAFFGVGGGLVLVPLLHLVSGISLKKAVGTSSVYMIGTTAVGLASYLVQGHGLVSPPPQTWNGVYWPAVAAVFPTAFLFNRVGSRLTNKAPVHLLKRGISGLLVILGGVTLARWAL